MKGHVTQQGKVWYAVIETATVDDKGKRKRKWLKLADCKGKRDAQTACAALITEMESGAHIEPSKVTVAQFFERWLKHIKPNVAPRTHERY